MLRVMLLSLLLFFGMTGFAQYSENSLDDEDALDAIDDSIQASPLYQAKEAQRLLITSLVLDGIGTGLLVYETKYMGKVDESTKMLTDVSMVMAFGTSVLCKFISIGKLVKIRNGLSEKASTNLRVTPNGAQMSFSYKF